MKKFFKEFLIGIAVAILLFLGLGIYGLLSKPDNLVPYSTEDMRTWMESQLNERQEQSTRLYESGDNISAQGIVDDMDEIQLDIFNHSAKLQYDVSQLQYTAYDQASYIEVSMTAAYDREYDKLTYVEDDVAAVEYLTSQINSGAVKDITFRTGPGWDIDRLTHVMTAASDNAADTASTIDRWDYYCGMEDTDQDNYITVSFYYRVDDQKLRDSSKQMCDALDGMAADIKAMGLTDAREMYMAAGKAICEAAEYDDEIPDLMFSETRTEEQWMESSAYGAVVMGKTICSGYAMAFKALCDRLDLPCWVVGGYNNSVAHAWNTIQIDGQTYYADCTFADGSWDYSYLIMDEDMCAARGYISSVNNVKPW